MTAKFSEISQAALALSLEEKLELASQLVAGAVAEAPSGYEAAWNDEVRRRREDVRTGKVKLVSSDEVEKSLDRLLG
jgi:putative addiction module component (TIGR02574 family)